MGVALYRLQSPQSLATLKQNAVIQSTESSNRIEGVIASSPKRLKQLIQDNVQPLDRSEQEIAGYRDVLNTIHGQYADMSFTSNLVLQLHRDLFRYTTEPGGNWKSIDNSITETGIDGKKRVRFQPTPAWLREIAMIHWREVLSTRSQSGSVSWKKFNLILQHYPICRAKVRYSYAEFQELGNS